MKLVSKLLYQAKKNGLDITKNDDVKIQNINTKKYVKILPNGTICSDNTLGQDKDLKCLMNKFLIKDPLLASGSYLALPCKVYLHVGKDTDQKDIIYATQCLNHCFANIKNLEVIEDHDLQSHECRIDHSYDLSYKERQAFIKACLEYLK